MLLNFRNLLNLKRAARESSAAQVQQLFAQGLALHHDHKLEEAREIYEQVLEMQPGHFDALHMSGVIAYQTGQFNRAVELIDKAIEQQPDRADAYFSRGIAQGYLGRFEAAVKSYDRAIALKPAFAEAYNNRGLALHELKQLGAAVDSFDRAIAFSPDFAEAQCNLGSVLKDLGQFEAALKCYDKGLAAPSAQMPDGPLRGMLLMDRWDVRRKLGLDRPYFSQAGQDEYLDRVVFHGRRGGRFAEIGAYDGVTGSNTLFFEKSRGWSGLLVEASPRLYAEVLRNRDTPCLNVAVAPAAGQAEFLEILGGYTQMGGLVGSLGRTARMQMEADPRTATEVIRVPTRPLADILRDHGLVRLDYLSIDIEGGERAVLEHFPFAEFEIQAWSIEVNEADPEIPRIMSSAGYALNAHVGVDQIWVRRDPTQTR